jgi:flavin-binding protein dodecin
MFRMIEIVGSSSVSFSEAVKGAVSEIIERGEKVHFFEVLEQRGAAREGAFKEFQVKLKVAVEFIETKDILPQEKQQVCSNCLVSTSGEGHLCVPTKRKDKKCQWCGALIVDQRHLCNDKIKQLSYICNSCGRAAVKAEHLCHPKKIK